MFRFVIVHMIVNINNTKTEKRFVQFDKTWQASASAFLPISSEYKHQNPMALAALTQLETTTVSLLTTRTF